MLRATICVLLFVGSLAFVLPSNAAPQRVDIDWTPSIGVADQGSSPDCVGYALHDLLAAAPNPLPAPTGRLIYEESKVRDGLPDTAGTWASAAAEWLTESGWIYSISFTHNLTDTITAMARGPFVIGVQWYGGMSTLDAGFARNTGDFTGNHEVMCYGYHGTRGGIGYFECQNSWGQSWGNGGSFKIAAATLAAITIDGYGFVDKAGQFGPLGGHYQ